MRNLLAIAVLMIGCTGLAVGDAIALFDWEFEDGSDTAVLFGPGDTAVINIFIEIDSLFAGWHFDLDALYDPAGPANFELTDVWAMPEADHYSGAVTPDVGDYTSFAEILEQQPGEYWLQPGRYLVEKLTLTAGDLPVSGTVCFDPTPLTGYNVLYQDPAEGVKMAETVTIPPCLTLVPEPTVIILMLLALLFGHRRYATAY